MKNRPPFFLIALLTLAPLVASANPQGARSGHDPCLQDKTCRTHVDTARTLSGAGLLAEALKEYEAAYARRNSPWLLFNMARLLDRMNRFAEARPYYQRYIDASGGDDSEQVRTARAALAQTGAQAANSAPVVPPPSPTESKPQLENTPPGSVPASILEPVREPLPPPQRPSIAQPLAAGFLLGGGLALIGAGLGFGKATKDVAGVLVTSSGSYDQGLYDYGQSLNRVSIGLDVVGGICAVAGLVWTTVLIAQRNKKSAPIPAMASGPGRAGFAFSRSF